MDFLKAQAADAAKRTKQLTGDGARFLTERASEAATALREEATLLRQGDDACRADSDGVAAAPDVSALEREELERLVGQLSGVQAQLQSQVRRARVALREGKAREQDAERATQLARQAAAIGAAQEAGFSLMRFGGSVSYPFFRQPALRD